MAKLQSSLGWMLGISYLLSPSSGGILAAASGEQMSDREKTFSIALPIAGSMLMAGAIALFKRNQMHTQSIGCRHPTRHQ